jgi:hypothetical protein
MPVPTRKPRLASRVQAIVPWSATRPAGDCTDLRGRSVIVVQTKPGRMGMYLMRQALFSGRLTQAAGAASMGSVLLCHKTDAALLPLLSSFPEVEVWLSDPGDPTVCRRVPVRTIGSARGTDPREPCAGTV